MADRRPSSCSTTPILAGAALIGFVGLAVGSVAGCTGAQQDGPPRTGDAPAVGAAPASGATATAQFGTENFVFDGVTCDLDDNVDDDILVRGFGATGDGRRFSLEVERMAPPAGVGSIYERVTLSLTGEGGLEGSWEATRTLSPGGQWTTGNGAELVDGPLLQITGGELVAAATYTYERFLSPDVQRGLTSDERRALREEAHEARPGTVKATCPAPAGGAP